MPNITGLSETKRALLEKYVRGNLPQGATTEIIPRRAPGSPASLSFGQQQLWFLAHLIPDVPVYNESVTVRLPGPLDVAALEQSLNEVVRRHEAWRTSFPLVDGQPVQAIQPAPTIKLPVVDLRYLPESRREAEALRRASEHARLPFDLAQGPLLRAILIRLGDQEHRLFFTLHHIIFDGITIYQVFLPEFHALYEAFSTGQPSPLPELPIQYADFAIWQRESLQENIITDQLAYWKKQLTGAPTLLDLPSDRPRPAVPTYRGSVQPFVLTGSLTAALRALSRQEDVTLYMLLLAVFNTLLYRYSRQEDILVGTATAGRNRPEVERLMGMFMNTVVMRTNLSGNPTFRELLGRVREVTLEAQAHADVPFEYVVKELQPERIMGQNPLFQVLLVLEPQPPVPHSGWILTHMDAETDTSKFDLSLILEDRLEGIIGRFEYNTDLFDGTTIERMIGHWQTLLEGIVDNPAQSIGELQLLTEAEQQVLMEWNDTVMDYPKDCCLHQLFEAQAERTPEAVAVVFENECLTYQELNRKANRLAHYLQQLGIGPEALVGICMERSLQMVVALLGILKSGGAYVPLDPAYPQERVAFMLQDARVSVLLTQRRQPENLPRHVARMICLDADWQTIALQSEENPVSTATPEHLAYVLYTSGSTGRPKGVAIEHRNAVAFVQWARSVFSREDLSGVLASTSICFDLSVFELFIPLICGGTVQLVENVLHLPGVSPDRRVTLVNTVPSAMAQLLRNYSLPASVQTVNLAGEPLYKTLVRQLYSQNTVQKVFNLYGPTETTTYSTYTLMEKGDREPSIGRPAANTQVYILDSHLQPVPIGVSGELYIGGYGVARGYLNRPELTVEKFIPHPFSRKPGARLYKTGDLARYLPNGSIEFLGRNDSQVKIRGFRIELGEIEEVLRQHPQVQEIVVVVREDSSGEKRLVAYIVPAQGHAPTVKDVQGFLQEKVPGYMVPSAFVLLNALPHTPNGKVDRHALSAREAPEHAREESFAAPTSLVHYQLISIWEELLGVRPIGIRDNFFLLGGHSLLAACLVDRIEQVFAKKITLPALFAGPTVEHLANVLQGQEDTALHPPVVCIQAGKFKRPFFFMHGDYKSGGFYCFPLARGLRSDQPFYALEPYRFDGLRVPPPLEAMAATHVELIRAVQPEGPYLLGGFCGGGLIAYEMARQLRARGQMLDLLVLIDPTPIAYLRSLHRIVHFFGNLVGLEQEKQLDGFLWLRHLYRYLQHLYRYLRFPRYRKLETELNIEQVKTNGGVILALKALHELRSGQDAGYLRPKGKAKPDGRSNQASFILPRLTSIFPDPFFPTAEARRQDWEGLFHWTASDYVPGFYPGKSTFFFFRDSIEEGRSGRWHKVSRAKDQEVEIHVISGTHDTSKTRHLHDLAERLCICLDKAQAIKRS